MFITKKKVKKSIQMFIKVTSENKIMESLHKER